MISPQTLTPIYPVVQLSEAAVFLDHLRKPVKATDRIEGVYAYYGANGQQGTINDYLFDEPLILLAEDGGNFADPARPIAYIASGKYWVNNHAHVIKPNENTDLRYLFWVLAFYDVTSLINGATRAKLNKSAASQIKIPLPPLSTQKKIVDILDRAQRLIDLRKEQIKEMDTLVQSLFYDMFGDPVSNPKGWEVRKLGELYINPKDGTRCGPFGSALKKNEYVSAGVPVWNMDNIDTSGQMNLPFRMWITEEKFESLKAFSVNNGDVLISRAGTVGKMCVARISMDTIISTNLIRVRFGDKILPDYFVSLMTFCKGRVGRLKTGPDGAFTHMNTGVLDNLEIPLPPIQNQKEYVDKVEAIKIKQLGMTESLVELETNFRGLMQRAFRGELV